MSDAILKVTNLRTSFKTAAGVVRAVDGVNFELGAGRYVIYSYTEDVTFTVMADWFIPGDLYHSPMDETATQLVTEVKVVF